MKAEWQSIAPSWERWRPRLAEGYAPIREWLVEALDVRPGQTILELAAGAGDTGFAAAVRLRPGGRLITSDIAPEMIAVARRRADELGVEGVEFRALDLERIALPDSAVDGVVCQSGYMLTADPARALAETRRVLRPGGRLAFSVWGAASDNPWSTTVASVLAELGHLQPAAGEGPGTFALGDENRLRDLVTGAGLETPRIERIRTAFRFDDATEYERWAVELGDVPAESVEGLAPGERGELRAALVKAMEPHRTEGGYALPGDAFAVLARRRPRPR